jgi:hypothetical protein
MKGCFVTDDSQQSSNVLGHSNAWTHFFTHWPAQREMLQTCHDMIPAVAALLVMLGVIYLLFGYNIYKGLVILNAAVMGATLGAALGESGHIEVPLAIVGGFAAAAVTWPLMKWAIAVMGGLFGAILGASLWRLFNLDPTFAWAGALTGLVALGLLSFILFRGCIMMYTSLQGSVMMIFGIVSLLSRHDSILSSISENIQLRPLLLPIAIFIPAIAGLIYQQHNGGAAAPQKH